MGVRMKELVDRFEAYNRYRGLSPETIEHYLSNLSVFRRWLKGRSPIKLGPRDIRHFLMDRSEHGCNASTLRKYFRVLSAFYSFLCVEGLVKTSANPIKKMPPPRALSPRIEPLSEAQAKRLLSAFDQSRPVQYRNWMICLLMLDTGLRVGEVCRLMLDDVDFEKLRLKVLGKGQKQRRVYMSECVAGHLKNYIKDCRPYFANGNVVLFPSSESGKKFTSDMISRIMKEKMDSVGIPRANSSAHRLRHTFAVNFLRGGGSAFHLQRLMGHSSLEMTKRYVMLCDDDLAEAHRRASPVNKLLG